MTLNYYNRVTMTTTYKTLSGLIKGLEYQAQLATVHANASAHQQAIKQTEATVLTDIVQQLRQLQEVAV